MKDKKKEQPAPEAEPAKDTAAPAAGQTKELPASDESKHKEKKKEHDKGPAPASAAPPEKEKKEADEERLLRVLADFDNFRKRTLREKNEIYQRAREDLVRELLPAVDHLDMALASAETDGNDSAFVKGVKLVSDQMLSVLKKFGLASFEAKGEMFDPARHEAIAKVEAPGLPEHTVVEQLRKGYMFGERLLRPAQVIVAEAAPAEAGPREGPIGDVPETSAVGNGSEDVTAAGRPR